MLRDQELKRHQPWVQGKNDNYGHDDEDDWDQHQDVATYLSVSVPQVYALVRSGQLPAIKIGGRGVWRVDRNQLEAYVEKLHEETLAWAKEHPLNPRNQA